MISSKLGFLPSSALVLTLATAVSLAPVQVAQAAPEEELTSEEDAPEEAAEEETAEGEPAEGETAEGEATEGEPAEVGEDQDEGEDESEASSEDEESEDEESEAESEVEAPAPEMLDAGPMRPPEPTWGRKNQHARDGKGMLIAGGLVTGLGAAFIVTSALITRCDFDSPLRCRYGDQREFLVPTAVATTALGLLLVGVGVGNHVKYKQWKNWTPETALVPSHVPGGGGVAWVGRF